MMKLHPLVLAATLSCAALATAQTPPPAPLTGKFGSSTPSASCARPRAARAEEDRGRVQKRDEELARLASDLKKLQEDLRRTP
jgi:TolA-binding protein